MKALEIADLTKYYGEVRGVENLSLNVEEGEFFGFIGPNGAGKSTTIRTLLGLIKATSGSAQILGMDYVKDRIDIMKHIGYLPSEVNLYGQLSGIAFLKYASKFYGDIDEKRINELAQWFEFDLSRPIEDLSFGNKKKIGIIQALLHRPKLLIMDEPTGGLDPLMQARFFELLKKENEKGTTIFFSSHTLSEVQRYCGKVAVIRDGHILEAIGNGLVVIFDGQHITYSNISQIEMGEAIAVQNVIVHTLVKGYGYDILTKKYLKPSDPKMVNL